MTQELDVSVVEVIQADRDAAAQRLRPISEHDPIAYTCERIRTGRFDGHAWVQAFARHRIAATRTSSPETRVLVEALEEALGWILDTDDEGAEDWGIVHEIRAALSLVREGEK